MEAARVPRMHADPRQLGLVGVLLVLALVGWVVTDERMAGMDAGPGTDPGALGFYVGVWVVMMAAMMFPSIAPMVLTYARIQRGRRSAASRAPHRSRSVSSSAAISRPGRRSGSPPTGCSSSAGRCRSMPSPGTAPGPTWRAG